MKLLLGLLFFTSVALGDAVIFSGNDVKALKYNLDLFGRSKVMGLNVNPSSGGGIVAPLGSIGMDYLTGEVYYKFGAADTQWTSISGAITGNPKQFAAYDANGILSDAPGVSYDETSTLSYGIIVDKNIIPTITDAHGVVIGTTYDSAATITGYSGFRINSNFGASTAISLNQIDQFAANSTLGPNLTVPNVNTFLDAQNITGGVTDYRGVNVAPTFNTTTMNTVQPITISNSIGNSSPTHLNGYTAIGSYAQVASDADIDNYQEIVIAPSLQPGAVVDGYTGLAHNPQIDASGINGYRGIILGANVGANDAISIDNHIDLQMTSNYRTGSSLNSYSAISIGPQFDLGSNVSGAQVFYANLIFDGQSLSNYANFAINGGFGSTTATSIGNYYDINFNPNFNANTTIDYYSPIVVKANTSPGSSITNDVTMIDLGINASIPVGGNANGIRVDMTNFDTDMNHQKSTFNGQGGSFANYSPFDTSELTPTMAFGNNSLGGVFQISSGSPVSGVFGFGNNLGITIFANDDMAADNFLGASSLGYSVNGFVNQLAVASGKTVDTVNYMTAGGSFPAPQSTGGTVTNLAMFRALGVINGGGTLNITNEIQFHADAAVDLGSPTNLWGFRADSTNADNWFAKNLVIGGSTMQPTNSSVGLEVAGTTKAILFPRMTTVQKNALTAVNGMQVYDTTLNQFECYANGSWGACEGAAGGDVSGPASAVDGQVALFDGVTGKLIKASTDTGVAKLVSGVLSASNVQLASEVSGVLPIANGGTNNGSLVVTAGGVLYTDGTKVENVGAGTSGQVLQSNGASAPSWVTISSGGASDNSYELTNLGIQTSVAANALTIALKQKDGTTDPASGSGAVKIGFRNSTASTGGYTQVSVTGSLSFTVSSGSELGTANNVPETIYIYAINNAGTAELAVSRSLYVDEGKLVTTLAEGGSGGADSSFEIYSATARTNVPVRLIGKIVITETTAGTWATNASVVSVAPFNKNTIETLDSYADRIERVRGTCSTSSTINSSSSAATIGNIVSGCCDITFGTPFSTTSDLTCVPTIKNGGSTTSTVVSTESFSAAGVTICASTGSNITYNFYMLCMGRR